MRFAAFPQHFPALFLNSPTGCGGQLADNSFMALMNVYADESCKDAHRFLALGAIAIEHAFKPSALKLLSDVRAKYNTWGEVKWTKCSEAKLPFYKAFVDVFFDCAATDDIHFHALYVDTHTFKNSVFNGGDREIGFNKLIYQLLLHKFGCKYGENNPMHVYLDARSSKHEPDSIRQMLNAEMLKRGVASYPFRRITFQDSKSTDLLQLNDLLVGTVGYKSNRHDKVVGCATHKVRLAQHILDRALENDKPHRLVHRGAKRFTIWRFAYK